MTVIKSTDPRAQNARSVPAALAERKRHTAIAVTSEIAYCLSQTRVALEALQQEHQTTLENAGPKSLEMAFMLAQRILRLELERSPDVLAHLANETRHMIARSTSVTLRCGPRAHALLAGRHSVFELDTNVVLDDTARPWALRFETPHGHIDAGLEDQLQTLAEALGAPAPDTSGISE